MSLIKNYKTKSISHSGREAMSSSFIIQIMLEMNKIQLKNNFPLKMFKTFTKLKRDLKTSLMKTT